MKWQTKLGRFIQDFPLTAFGAWIIWKQVYAANPNGYLALIGFACMVPAARSAVLTILSLPGQSSESPPQASGQSSLPPPPQGGTGEKPLWIRHHVHHILDNERPVHHGITLRDP